MRTQQFRNGKCYATNPSESYTAAFHTSYPPGMRFALTVTLALALPAFAQSRPNASLLLAEARAAEQANDLPTAIRDYRLLATMRPGSGDANADLGSALALEGKYDEAILDFRAAIALTPIKRQADLFYAIGLAYSRKGDLLAARTPLQSALDIQPAHLAAATLLADCDLKLNDPAAALAVTFPRSGLAANNPQFAYVLALALIRTGKLFDGAQMLERVGTLTNNAETFQLAGSTFLDDDEVAAARRNLEIAHHLNPALPGVDVLLSIARERSGDTFAAEALFRDTLKSRPHDFNANLYLGALLLNRRALPQAKPFLDQALASRPSDPLALYEAAMWQTATGHPEPAIAELNQSAAHDPAWSEPHTQLAVLYDNLNRPTDAVQERALATRLTAAQLEAHTVSPRLP